MPINHPVVATAGVVAISVAIAAAIAVYENPELRRMAEDLRRKIALAFHSFGDVIEPNSGEPLFNRPEDAEGFLHSRGNTDPGVSADDETLQRQRQELMYWNALRLEKQARDLIKRQRAEEVQAKLPYQENLTEKSDRPSQPHRATTFDDFLSPDGNSDRGTFVFNTGANIHPDDQGLVQRRQRESSRGLEFSTFIDPFSDDHQVSDSIMAPSRGEMSDLTFARVPSPKPSQPFNPAYAGSDIYDDVPTPRRRLSMSDTTSQPPILLWNHSEDNSNATTAVTGSGSPSNSAHSETVGYELPVPEVAQDMVAPIQESSEPAFASIQAWAQSQNSNPSFYSPIPVSPAAPLSEFSDPDVISRGDLTPTYTDSISLVESGEYIANEANSRPADNFDVMSESDGMITPASWTEVGSVVSEDDQPVHA